MDDELIRIITCATGRKFIPRQSERCNWFARRRYANDIRCAPARHLNLVTVPAGPAP